jgi:hypothetical protein
VRIANALITFLFLIPTLAFSQITIDDVGDGWKGKVDSAISLIQKTDTISYQILMENCKNVEFIIGKFSTTKPPFTIAITTKDMNLNSINNIAAVLVHESYHLFIYNNHIQYNERDEEVACYVREYEFLCKLPDVEDWLFLNAMNNIILYKTPKY